MAESTTNAPSLLQITAIDAGFSDLVPGQGTVTYTYDSQSRRIRKTTTAAAYQGASDIAYLYQGWNVVAEYSNSSLNTENFELKTSYTWGMDMSGSMQGAGGVGGLLAMTVHDTTTATFYPTYDGNGNVSEYINQSGADVAHFEYDPFGNLTVDRDGNANQFPYRFSTKPQDLTTGLLYYGYRYYDHLTGRWPSRDPIEERGGINLYGFVGNDGVNWYDLLGYFRTSSLHGLTPAEAAALNVGRGTVTRPLPTPSPRPAPSPRPIPFLPPVSPPLDDSKKRHCCLECVTDVNFIKGDSHESPGGLLSWSFEIKASRTLTKRPAGQGGETNMQWSEWTEQDNRLPSDYQPYLDPNNPNRINITSVPELMDVASGLQKWRNRTGLCPHSDIVTLSDNPGANPSEKGDRTLFIQVVFTNPEGCANRVFAVTIVHTASASPIKIHHLNGRVSKW